MRESHYQSARSARAKDKERNASLQINKKRRVFSLLALFFLALISLALTSLALILFALSSPRNGF
jgi:membrane-anchored glycerophosphoryl diester phosphodiesterase (GDPDase)